MFNVGEIVMAKHNYYSFLGLMITAGNTYEVLKVNRTAQTITIKGDRNWQLDFPWTGFETKPLGQFKVSYTYFDENGMIEDIITEKSVCECGSDKANQPKHSSWCPKHS